MVTVQITNYINLFCLEIFKKYSLWNNDKLRKNALLGYCGSLIIYNGYLNFRKEGYSGLYL